MPFIPSVIANLLYFNDIIGTNKERTENQANNEVNGLIYLQYLAK
jgi:hypothetical protein